jgi:hypothetical protein
MGKHSFDWSVLPVGLRRQLAEELGVPDDDLPRVLEAKVGEQPTEQFVKSAWPALRDRWIARDPAVRRSVVSALRVRGLGNTSISASSAKAQVDYLRSCRNAPALRSIVLAHLLALDRRTLDAPTSTGELRERVREVLGRLLGVREVSVDADGDIPIPSTASLTYVRVFEDAPIVRVFSPILWGLDRPADIEATVNEINRHTNWVKAVWEDGAIVLFSDVVGDPLAEPQLAAAVQSVIRRADEMGPELQQRYGGRIAFGEPLPSRQPPAIGGYL